MGLCSRLFGGYEMEKSRGRHLVPFEDKDVAEKERHDIAIVGVACRFPGANSHEEFWENIKSGISSISEIPDNRWEIEKYYSAQDILFF
jgi:hypothetical protein